MSHPPTAERDVGRILRPALGRPPVPPALVLRLQKYRDLGRVPSAIQRAAEAASAEATGLVDPQAVLWRGPVAWVEPTGLVTLGASHRFHSRTLARLLVASPEAVVFVMTIGPRIEERVGALLADKLYVEGLLLDTAAWAAIELLRRELRQRLLVEERTRGGALTARLGPGHGDWPVEEQPALLRVFGDTPLPVTVNEAACLWPRKSVSGLFGVGRGAGL